MRYTQLTEKDKKAIVAPPEPKPPSKDALLRQIEIEWVIAEDKGDKDEMKRLEKAHAEVLKARKDKTANEAFKRELGWELNSPPPPIPEE